MIIFIYHALFQRDDRVVSDVNFLGTNLSAALCNIAKSQPEFIFQKSYPRDPIQRMHLQRGHSHEETRSAKFIVFIVLAQNMANVLAQETLNALAELLHPVNIFLQHLPLCSRTRLESRNLLVHFVIPGNISHQVLDHRE